MTREEAKIYAKLSREDVEKINEGYAKHYDMICAFANGEEIEFKQKGYGHWIDNADPKFDSGLEYRVKPSDASQPAEPWKPKDGEKFFCVCGDGEVCFVDFDEGFENDNEFIDFGNCFRTREEAEAARERVRAALKGETLAATEKLVESFKGVPLTDDERTLLCCFRNARERGIFAIEKAFMFESVRESGVELIVPDEQGRRELYMAIKSFTKEATK